MARIDLVAGNYGSIISITAASGRGRAWMADHVLAEGQGEHVYCEHRYGIDILIGAVRDGLRVQDGATGKIASKAAAEQAAGL